MREIFGDFFWYFQPLLYMISVLVHRPGNIFGDLLPLFTILGGVEAFLAQTRYFLMFQWMLGNIPQGV